MSRLTYSLATLLLVLAGCEAAVPPPDESSSEDERRRTEDYGPRVAHTIDGMKFDDPAHERLLRRFRFRARRLAGERLGTRGDYNSRPEFQVITATWANSKTRME